jgi:hypothetical protein
VTRVNVVISLKNLNMLCLKMFFYFNIPVCPSFVLCYIILVNIRVSLKVSLQRHIVWCSFITIPDTKNAGQFYCHTTIFWHSLCKTETLIILWCINPLLGNARNSCSQQHRSSVFCGLRTNRCYAMRTRLTRLQWCHTTVEEVMQAGVFC